MAEMYDKGRQRFLDGAISWSADTIRAILVDAGTYTLDIAANEFLTDIPGGAIVATSPPLTAKTSTAGVADADDVTFSAVTGATAEAIVLYKDTGVAATSPLIAYLDGGTGLPVTPNGDDIVIAWSSDAFYKIFRL